MKQLLSWLLIIASLTSCALTTPEGTKELMDDISRDRASKQQQEHHFVGKPVFLKVRAYPRVEGSNIYGKHWILMKAGHEALNLEPLLIDIVGER